jgi:hypothetical protein
MKKHIFIAALVSAQLQYVSAQSWKMRESGFVARHGIIDIAAPNENDAYAMAYDADDFLGINLNDVTITHNGGQSWKAQTVTLLNNHRIMGLSTAVGNTIHVLGWNTTGTGSGGKLVRSTNGGTTWAQEGSNIFNNVASFPDAIAFMDEKHGFVLGDPINNAFEIFITNNGGKTWSQVPANKIPTPIATATQFEWGASTATEVVDNTYLTITLVYNNDMSTAYGRLFQSVDFGNSWSVKCDSLPITAGDISIKFRDKNNGLLKNGGKLYRTTNGGAKWKEVSYKGYYCQYDLDNVPGRPGTWISTGGDVIKGYTWRKGSSISYDDGINWKAIDTVINHSCIEMTSAHSGYTGGVSTNSKGKDGVYVYNFFKSLDEETIINETVSAATPIELTVYPNPSSESFSVTLNSPLARVAAIRVITANGAVVSTQRIVPVGTITFGADLAPGIYIAEIMIDGETKTFQIVKQ